MHDDNLRRLFQLSRIMRRRALLLALFALRCAFACRIGPPYRGVAVVQISVDDGKTLEKVRKALEAICEVRMLDPERGPLSLGVRRVLLTREQVALVWRLLPNGGVRVLYHDLAERLVEGDDGGDDGAVSLGYAATVDNTGGFGNSILDVTSAPTEVPIATSAPVEILGESFYKKYHDLNEYVARWRTINETYGEDVRMEIIGHSVEGRPLHLLRIGNTTSDNPHRVLIQSMLHAREWVTPLAATYTIERLAAIATGLDGSRELQALLSRVEVLILPLMNPDGFVFTRERDRFWRKNRSRSPLCNTSEIYSGVDLNRNFGVDFGGTKSTSFNSCDDLYTGTRAFSAPEADAIRRLALRTPGLRAHLDVHAYGQILIGPWVHTAAPPRTSAEIDRVGDAIAHALSAKGASYHYGRGINNGLYLASGTATDWFYARGVLAYGVELRPQMNEALGFELPTRQILPAADDTFRAVAVLVAHAGGAPLPTVGMVPRPVAGVEASDRAPAAGVVALSVAVVAVVLTAVTLLLLLARWRHRKAVAAVLEEGDDSVVSS